MCWNFQFGQVLFGSLDPAEEPTFDFFVFELAQDTHQCFVSQIVLEGFYLLALVVEGGFQNGILTPVPCLVMIFFFFIDVVQPF